MTDKINCPYCTGVMRLLTLGLNEHKHYFYECAECGSRSPMAHNEIMANSMARMRGKPLETANKSASRLIRSLDYPYRVYEKQGDGSWLWIFVSFQTQSQAEEEVKHLTAKNKGEYMWKKVDSNGKVSK